MVTKRLSAPARRASIIEVAQRLFSRKGFHGVSIDEIVKVLGVSPAVLYRHFSSKDALYQEVLTNLACKREDYIKAVIANEEDFAIVLRTMIRIFAKSITDQPDVLRLELHSRLEGNAATHDFFVNRWKTFTDYITFNIDELQQQGRCTCVNASFSALAFQGMIREILMTTCLTSDDLDLEGDLTDLIDRAVDFFLSAIQYEPLPK